jgi:insertion element IS1 protein InsB
MALSESLCSRCVGDCAKMIKYGKTKSGNQRYICKTCNKSRVKNYIYKAYGATINTDIVLLTKEGLGIRSTARVLKISANTLLRRIVNIAQSIKQPIIPMGKTFEVDEMRSFVKRKDKWIWIVYALERETKKVVSLHVGRRTNQTLNVVLTTVKKSRPLAIYTDKLKQYRYLIDPDIHKTRRFGTNHIERKNLSVRTHLKRLNRRTICFSRSRLVLVSILKIYFWG